MNLPTDQVLVTGATGWLGSRLTEALAQGLPETMGLSQPGRRVRGLVKRGEDRSPSQKASEKIELVTGDLQEPADLARVLGGRHVGRDALVEDEPTVQTGGLAIGQHIGRQIELGVQGPEHRRRQPCNVEPRQFDAALVRLCEEAVREETGDAPRLPSSAVTTPPSDWTSGS